MKNISCGMKKSEKLGLRIEDEMIPKMTILSKYYLESRYPDILEEDLNNRKYAEEALEFAREIVGAIKKQIPKTPLA